jgi:hypothetical protein
MSDLLGDAIGTMIGLSVGERIGSLRAQMTARRFARGTSVTLTAFVRAHDEHVARRGRLTLARGDEHLHWRPHRREPAVALVLLQGLGVHEVQRENSNHRTWTWLVRVPDGATARLSMRPQHGRAFARLLHAPEAPAPNRHRR